MGAEGGPEVDTYRPVVETSVSSASCHDLWQYRMPKHDMARARLVESEEMQLPRLSMFVVDAGIYSLLGLVLLNEAWAATCLLKQARALVLKLCVPSVSHSAP